MKSYKRAVMSQLYVTEHGTQLGVEGNRLTIKYKDGMLKSLPIETIDGICILGRSTLTSGCMETCLKKGISVAFFSKGGRYFGRLMSTGHVKAALQRKQASLYHTPFAMELSKKLISAKINNQLVVLKRYARDRDVDIECQVSNILNSRKKVSQTDNVQELMGYEGTAARSYFEGLGLCIDEEFRFDKRTRRPPMDEFNSLISLGYSIIMNEIYCETESLGLNPYFGFMHRDIENHPTLASDMMEEWRAVLVDSLAMSLINGHEIKKDDFVMNLDAPGCFLTREGLRIFIRKFEEKMSTKTRYIPDLDYPVDFRKAIRLQAENLVKAIDGFDTSLYNPIMIR